MIDRGVPQLFIKTDDCRLRTSYDTAEELLADPAIDVVSVCAANNAHAELTIRALKAGKHVLCEKPMAISLADCEEMVKVAKEEGKLLMIGQNQRLTKAHALAKKMIAEGEIGKVITFRTSFGHGGPETWSITPGKNTWFFGTGNDSWYQSVVFLQQMDDGLRVRLALEYIAVRKQFLAQGKEVFDDPVAHDGEGSVVGQMRVGIDIRRRAVGRPPGVPDADVAGDSRAVFRLFAEPGDPPAYFLNTDLIVAHHGDARRIVAPVFQLLQALPKDGHGTLFPANPTILHMI